MKNKNYMKAAAISLCMAFLAGCGGNAPSETTDISVTEETTTAFSETSASTSAIAIADEEEPVITKEPAPLKIAVNESNHLYSPFTAESDYDNLINSLTGVSVVSSDRDGNSVVQGKTGTMIMHKGKYYGYRGAADITAVYNEETDTTRYGIYLRDNMVCPDGKALDADDLIFTLYVLLDPSYNGSVSLGTIDILGAKNYRMNSSIADTITEEEIEAALSKESVQTLIHEEIIVPVINEEFENVKSLYGDPSYGVYTDKYAEPKDLMAYFYSINSEYDSTAADEKTVLSDLAEMYGSNYKLLGSMVSGDDNYYNDDVRACAVKYITEEKGESSEIPSVSGIKKDGNYTVYIDVKGTDDTILSVLEEVIIAPLHYYGDESKYSYSDNRFGFEKGDVSPVLSANAGLPFGAGAYSYKKTEGGSLILQGNKHYFKSAPLTEEIHIFSGTAQKAVSIVEEGTADISFPESSAETYGSIDAANKSIEKLSPYFSEEAGYGYIGLNAAAVSVNGDPASKESVSLRKAIASVIAYYKDLSAGNYFGKSGITTDYPIINSVIIPEGGEDYVTPYSLDKNGEAIITVGMTEEEQLASLKAACIDYLEAADYTFADNKLTEAPEGGKTAFTAYVLGNGTGNHPAAEALYNASALLSEIGISLDVKDVADASIIWNAVSEGTHEIWAGVWNDSLSTVYSENSYYGISDDAVAERASEISDASEYKAFYDSLFSDWAVEIPCYRRESCTLFSSLRIDMASLPETMTESYSWEKEAEKIIMK